ncbi:MAG: GGDEF domain-containing protein [Pseudomonadota bacterium]
MSQSHAVTALLRRFTVVAAPTPAPMSTPGPAQASVDDWNLMFDAVTAQLSSRPDPTGERAQAAQALACLHGLLQTERQAHADVAQQLAGAQALLVATQAALAVSRRQERRARHSALHDSLTALPNRAFFRSRLDDALRLAGHDGALAVLVLDLDGFKPVNDSHGHAIGDALLKIVAARLAHAVRDSDWVARLGGDEFACVLTGVPGRARLKGLATALYDAISAPIALGHLRLHVRPSIGIAVHDGTAGGDTLIARADAAMFCAKRARSGPTFCDGEAV